MRRVYEAPKATRTIRKLRTQAAENERFFDLVCGLRELMVDHCASAAQMRKAVNLAIHEQTWSNYRISQNNVPTEPVGEDEDDDGDFSV